MNDMQSTIEQRELCQQRDKEFLALYCPTLDALIEKGVPESKARRAAAEFTIAIPLRVPSAGRPGEKRLRRPHLPHWDRDGSAQEPPAPPDVV